MISNADKAMLSTAAKKAATTSKVTGPSSIPVLAKTSGASHGIALSSKLSIRSVTRDTFSSIAKNVSNANTQRFVQKPRSQLPSTPVSISPRPIHQPLATTQKVLVEVQNVRAPDIKTPGSPKPTRLLTPITAPLKVRTSAGFNTRGAVKGHITARLSAAVQKPRLPANLFQKHVVTTKPSPKFCPIKPTFPREAILFDSIAIQADKENPATGLLSPPSSPIQSMTEEKEHDVIVLKTNGGCKKENAQKYEDTTGSLEDSSDAPRETYKTFVSQIQETSAVLQEEMATATGVHLAIPVPAKSNEQSAVLQEEMVTATGIPLVVPVLTKINELSAVFQEEMASTSASLATSVLAKLDEQSVSMAQHMDVAHSVHASFKVYSTLLQLGIQGHANEVPDSPIITFGTQTLAVGDDRNPDVALGQFSRGFISPARPVRLAILSPSLASQLSLISPVSPCNRKSALIGKDDKDDISISTQVQCTAPFPDLSIRLPNIPFAEPYADDYGLGKGAPISTAVAQCTAPYPDIKNRISNFPFTKRYVGNVDSCTQTGVAVGTIFGPRLVQMRRVPLLPMDATLQRVSKQGRSIERELTMVRGRRKVSDSSTFPPINMIDM